MQQEKKRSGRRNRPKNPEVSVRVNVRPLRSNWKPVKRVEFDGVSPSTETPSPAQDQLDSNVWKTKNVRTEFVAENFLEKEEPSTQNSEESTCSSSKNSISGVVTTCDCPACRRANDAPISVETAPKQKKNRSKKERNSVKAKKLRKRSRQSGKSGKSVATPPPVPPNSVASRDSQQKWSKLYDEVCHAPAKPIDLKKISALPGQIGLSELEPEDPDHPVTPDNSERTNPRRSPTQSPNFFHRHPSPKVMKRPLVSPVSSFDQQHQNLPPLIPQPTVHCEPPNVQPPPIEAPPGLVTSMVHKVMGTTTTTTTSEHHDAPPPPPKSSQSASLTLKSIGNGSCNEISKPIDTHHEPLPLVSAKPSQVSVFRQMEQYFYGSEANWWLFVAFVILTIFAYRSSIEQHTCYYD